MSNNVQKGQAKGSGSKGTKNTFSHFPLNLTPPPDSLSRFYTPFQDTQCMLPSSCYAFIKMIRFWHVMCFQQLWRILSHGWFTQVEAKGTHVKAVLLGKLKGAQCTEPVKSRVPSIWFVWKIWDFLVTREQKFGARGHRALLEHSPACPN